MTFKINSKLPRLILNSPRAYCQECPILFQTTSQLPTGLQLNRNYIPCLQAFASSGPLTPNTLNLDAQSKANHVISFVRCLSSRWACITTIAGTTRDLLCYSSHFLKDKVRSLQTGFSAPSTLHTSRRPETGSTEWYCIETRHLSSGNRMNHAIL